MSALGNNSAAARRAFCPRLTARLDTDWRGRARCAGTSGRSVRFASAIRLDPLDQHGSDASSNGSENSRSRTERRTPPQSRRWRATVPSAAPTAPGSSPCASPPCNSPECTRSGDSAAMRVNTRSAGVRLPQPARAARTRELAISSETETRPREFLLTRTGKVGIALPLAAHAVRAPCAWPSRNRGDPDRGLPAGVTRACRNRSRAASPRLSRAHCSRPGCLHPPPRHSRPGA